MRSSRQDVSGNYAGAVTRLLAHWVDLSVAGLLFVAGSAALDHVLRAIVGVDRPTDDSGMWRAVAAAVWLFVYWWVSVAIAGKTPGKALLGLRVLSRDGDSVVIARCVASDLASTQLSAVRDRLSRHRRRPRAQGPSRRRRRIGSCLRLGTSNRRAAATHLGVSGQTVRR